MKPTMRSNASIFEDRGDPWVSGKEGRTQYGRIAQTENPDLDMFTRAKKPEERHERGSETRTETVVSPERRKANVMLRLHRELREQGFIIFKHNRGKK